MERIQESLQGNLFDRESPLPVTTRKEILPLIAALIAAVMASTCPPGARTGDGDDD